MQTVLLWVAAPELVRYLLNQEKVVVVVMVVVVLLVVGKYFMTFSVASRASLISLKDAK